MTDETAFAGLEAEWNRLLETERAEHAVRTHEQAAGWKDGFDTLYREYQELRTAGRWLGGPTDFLGVLGRSRRELHHSAVLAWLFDPCGHHGLGTGFLERVFTLCFPGERLPEQLGLATVDCEVVRPEARADIVVWSPELTLVIENKVDAREQPDQCDRLHEGFSGEPGARFVFLSPSGKKPRTATTPAAKRAFKTLGYRPLRYALVVLTDRLPDPLPQAWAVVTSYLENLRREFP